MCVYICNALRIHVVLYHISYDILHTILFIPVNIV